MIFYLFFVFCQFFCSQLKSVVTINVLGKTFPSRSYQCQDRLPSCANLFFREKQTPVARTSVTNRGIYRDREKEKERERKKCLHVDNVFVFFSLRFRRSPPLVASLRTGDYYWSFRNDVQYLVG